MTKTKPNGNTPGNKKRRRHGHAVMAKTKFVVPNPVLFPAAYRSTFVAPMLAAMMGVPPVGITYS